MHENPEIPGILAQTEQAIPMRVRGKALQGKGPPGLRGLWHMKTDYLLHKELELILAALMPSNALVIRTMLQTGLRVGDVLSLRPEQLAPRMWVTESKTGKRRQVGLGKALERDLRAHSGKTWVFPGHRDKSKPRTRQAVWWDVKRAARAFRLPQNVGTHSVRKVYAVDLLAQYGDIERVRRALRHDSVSTTLIYAMADKLLRGRAKR